MDLFDLQAKITLDSSEYERGIQNAARNTEGFTSSFDQIIDGANQATGSLDDLANGVLQGLTEGLREAAAAGQDVSQLQGALDEASQGFIDGSESAEDFLNKLRDIASEAGVSIDPLENLGDAAEDAGEGHEDAGESASMFASMLKSNIYTQAITKAVDLLKQLVTETVEYGDAVDKSSQKLGISASAYQKWDAVLQHSGSSMGSMSATFKTLANAAQDASDDQVKAFERIGLSMDEVSNMATEDLFGAVIRGLQNMEQGTERTALATDLLGRGAMELGPLLNTSADDTQAMLDRVDALGGVMSDDAVKASAAFQDAMQDLTTAIEGNVRNMSAKVLPVLTDVIEFMNEANEQAGLAGTVSQDTLDSYDTASEKLIALKDNYHEVNEAAKELALSGEYDQMAGAQLEINNAWEQYQQTLEELRPEVFEELKNGTIGVATAAEALGVSASELRNEMQVSGEMNQELADSAENVAEELDEEAVAAQEAHDALIGIASEAIDLRYSNKDLREEYERLEKEFESVKDDGDEVAVMLAQQKLQALNLAATNQELARGYPAIVSRLNNFGVSLTQTSAWLDANGMSAEDWGNAVNSATNDVINGFQDLDTSLDMSLEDMASSMQSNIEAYANWNQNIADLMEYAKSSGNDAAVAFVQYMADMGIGAADQVALMAQDMQGTFDTFAPMMGDAIDQGMLQVYNGIEGSNVGSAMDGNMDDVIAAVEGTDLSGPGRGLDTSLASGVSGSSYAVSNAASRVVSGAKSSASYQAGNFYYVGTAMDDGIVSGLNANAYKVKNAAASIAKRAVAAAKAALDINSPSKVFRDEVGAAIPEGLALGIDQNAGLVESSIKRLAGATSGWYGDMDYGYRQPSDAVYGVTGNTVNNYITVNGAENPEDYANRLAREIKLQMRTA